MVVSQDCSGGAWDGRMTAGFTAGTGKTSAGHAISEWSMHEVAGKDAKDGRGGEGFFSSLLGGR